MLIFEYFHTYAEFKQDRYEFFYTKIMNLTYWHKYCLHTEILKNRIKINDTVEIFIKVCFQNFYAN